MKITAGKRLPDKVGHRNQGVVEIEMNARPSGVGEGGISGREWAMQGMLDHFAHSLADHAFKHCDALNWYRRVGR